MKCFIVDIDGTVADATHRLHHIQGKPKDWDAFFAAVVNDKPIKHMQHVVNALWYTHDIIWTSGRPERTRGATFDWLMRHNFVNPNQGRSALLYMRADGDRRDDSIVKSELLARIRADGYEPIMAFDDRNRVVDMWRANGVPCAQVAPGDF